MNDHLERKRKEAALTHYDTPALACGTEENHEVPQ
jgi:hypothetical protein